MQKEGFTHVSETQPVYDPRIFLQDTMENAQAIILTPEVGQTTQERWEIETAWLGERIHFSSTDTVVLDYGCGVGRIAKIIPNPVLGIDISPTMRTMAPLYVSRISFDATHPPMLRHLVDNGFRARGAVAIWTLQHVLDLSYDCLLLADALMPGSYLWTLDDGKRYVPVNYGDHFTWADDGQSVVDNLANNGFRLKREERPPLTMCAEGAVFRQWVRM